MRIVPSLVATPPRFLLIVSLVSLFGCEGDPGASRITVHAAEDGRELWTRTFQVERFDTLPSDSPETLRIQGYDACWGAAFERIVARSSGDTLENVRKGVPEAEVQKPSDMGSATITSCTSAGGSRVTLSNERVVEVCTGKNVLSVLDVDTGDALLSLTTDNFIETRVVSEHLLVFQSYSRRIDMYTLDSGELLWTWTGSDEFMQLLGIDAARIYVWQPTPDETLALSVDDGTPGWQANLGCDWLRYIDGVLACGKKLRESTCSED